MMQSGTDTEERSTFLSGLSKLSTISVFFLGLGVYRAWIELVFVAPVIAFPAYSVAGNNAYDIFMIIALLAMAASSRRLAPYLTKRAPYIICFLLMTSCTVLAILSYYLPAIAGAVAIPAALLGGTGTALVILLWSELYGCMGIRKVAICYSASMILAAFIIFMMRGLVTSYFMGVLVALPLIALSSVWHAFKTIPETDRPRQSGGRFSFPTKPIVLTTVYAFAFGLIQTRSTISGATHSSLATVAAAAIVLCIALWSRKQVGFGLAYRVAFPIMVFGLLLVPAAFPQATDIAAFCTTMSYGAFWILMMLICSHLCHSYGVSAVWLFGIERAMRAGAQMCGRLACSGLALTSLDTGTQTAIITIASVMMVIAGTTIFFSERDFSTRWGIQFLNPDDAEPAIAEKNRLIEECDRITKEYKLSQRETEVLRLLAQKKTLSDVENELFIAEGTAKAHMRHIYEKLDIHSRKELFAMLGIDEP